MGPLPWTIRFRQWLAYEVILGLLWWVAGEQPKFCDIHPCPLYEPAEEGKCDQCGGHRVIQLEGLADTAKPTCPNCGSFYDQPAEEGGTDE